MEYKLKKFLEMPHLENFIDSRKGGKTSIIVQANKEKFKNLITYIVVNDILKK